MPVKEIVVMRGLSGSGKTTWVHEKLRKEERYASEDLKMYAVFSADDFWGEDYDFDHKRIGEAHSWCMRQFAGFVSSEKQGLGVVDNTNTTVDEMAGYLALAAAFGWSLRIVTLIEPIEVCASRSKHSVPVTAMANAMNRFERIEGRRLLPYWPKEEIYVSGVRK